jgi:hypothetical protein
MNDTLLKRAALTDGTVSLLFALPLITLASDLSKLLGLSVDFLIVAGWAIVPPALLFLWIARTGSRPLATFGVIGNAAWVVTSFAAIPLLQPSLLGVALIAAQGLAVAAFGWFQFRGLKQIRNATA